METFRPQTSQETETDTLLARIWEQKRGKLQGFNPYTLYTSIASPRLNLPAITHDVLQALVRNPQAAHTWASRFGKVAIGIDQSGASGSTLEQTSGTGKIEFIQMESSQVLRPADVVAALPQNPRGKIVLHDVPQPVEAFLISYIHMLDEYVWVLAQQYEGEGRSPVDAYTKALLDTRDNGFSVTLENQDTLLRKASQDQIAIRLYGSKAHPGVPFVMGGIEVKPLPSDYPISHSRYIDKLVAYGAGRNARGRSAENSKQTENVQVGNVEVAVGITFGKEVHAGHMLLLAIADLVRTGIDSSSPLTIVNNNTGPRPAAALQLFASKSHLSIPEAIKVLDDGRVTSDEVMKVYMQRDDAVATNQLIAELDSAGVDIFSSVTEQNQFVLQQAGFNVAMLSESRAVLDAERDFQKSVPDEVSEWIGTGFIPFPIGHKETSIVQKSGLYTEVGKAVLSHTTLLRRRNAQSVVMVDSGVGTRAAAYVLDKMMGPSGISRQAYGAGFGMQGRIASGTKGEAYTVSALNRQFDSARSVCTLRDALVFMALTYPMSCDTSRGLTESHYDFSSNQAFVDSLGKSAEELMSFVDMLQTMLTTLKGKIADTTDVSDKGAIGIFVHSGSLLKKYAARPKIDSMSLMGSIKKVEGKDDIRSILQACGYTGASLDGMVRKYTSGERFFAFRLNESFEQLKRIIQKADAVTAITQASYEDIEKIVKICVGRLGISHMCTL